MRFGHVSLRLCTAPPWLAAALIAACATPAIELGESGAVPAGEGVVFGRFRLIYGGEVTEDFSTVLGESTMRVVVLPDASSRATFYPLTGDGRFYWHLPAGRYAIAGFEGYVRVATFPQSVSGRIFAHFEAAPDAPRYIGTLTVRLGTSRYAAFVEDEFPAAAGRLRQRFPRLDGEPQKALMVMEEQR